MLMLSGSSAFRQWGCAWGLTKGATGELCRCSPGDTEARDLTNMG